MRIEDCYQLGNITKPHGLQGEVQAYLDVDVPEEYTELESVFVEINQKLVPFFVESMSLRGNKAIVAFEDITTLEQAESLRGSALYLPLDVLPDLGEDQFYYHEIIGFTVQDAVKGALGTVAEVYAGGMQDIIRMDYEGKEVLIPVSDGIIGAIDREAKLLHVSLPEGLLDIYLS